MPQVSETFAQATAYEVKTSPYATELSEAADELGLAKKQGESLGACLLKNDTQGIGAGMIEARKKGVSWADIAKQFNLPNPSAARKAFTKYTGITDYKAKGQTLEALVKQMAEGTVDTGVKVAAKAVKATEDAVKAVDPSKITFVADKTPLDVTAAKVSDPVSKGKWLDSSELADATGVSQTIVEEVAAWNKQGKGYTAIKQNVLSFHQETIDFSTIDMIVWNDLLKSTEGRVWEAYLQKPTSETGFNAVKQKVLDLHAKGLDAADIAKVKEAPPESVVDAIIKDKWSMPPMGSTNPIIPPPPPPPPVIYTGQVSTGRNFVHRSHEEMTRWEQSLPKMTEQEFAAMKRYTGSGYSEMNGRLRQTPHYLGQNTNTPSIKNLAKAMRPLDADTSVVRQVHSIKETFKVTDLHDTVGTVGTVFKDEGFMSTTIKPDGTWSGNVKLHINVPAGHPVRYVGETSSHKHERELILQRGTKMVITKVQKLATNAYGEGTWEVWAEVIGV